MINQMDDDRLMVIRRSAFVTQLARGLRRCGTGGGDRLLLAVSGGADSTALLMGCAALAGRKPWNLDLHVGHVNHHLRAQAADEARFVEQLCNRLGVRFHHKSIHPGHVPGNVEAQGRRLRYGALSDMAREIDADAIVTAHHADDQLETLLMRLMRGSSIEGLAGIAMVREMGDRRVIRPMLHIASATGRQMLSAAGQSWCEDRTNADVSRTRARLRMRVLPELLAMKPDASVRAASAAEQLREARSIVRRAISQACRKHVTGEGRPVIGRNILRSLSPLIQTGVIRQMCSTAGVEQDRLPQRLLAEIAAAACDSSNQTRQWHLAGDIAATLDACELAVGQRSD